MRFLGGESTESEEADPSQFLMAIKLGIPARLFIFPSPSLHLFFPVSIRHFSFPPRFRVFLCLFSTFSPRHSSSLSLGYRAPAFCLLLMWKRRFMFTELLCAEVLIWHPWPHWPSVFTMPVSAAAQQQHDWIRVLWLAPRPEGGGCLPASHDWPKQKDPLI